MALIVLLRRAAPKLPGLILTASATFAIVTMAALPVDTIYSRFAFLAGVESLLSAMVSDKMMGGLHRPNAEVLAQGIANIGSALFGGLPGTGVIARTATNIRAGGKPAVAGLVHTVTIFW